MQMGVYGHKSRRHINRIQPIESLYNKRQAGIGAEIETDCVALYYANALISTWQKTDKQLSDGRFAPASA